LFPRLRAVLAPAPVLSFSILFAVDHFPFLFADVVRFDAPRLSVFAEFVVKLEMLA
jgi:hypothetical protein